MLENLAEHLNVFIKLADEVRLDTTLHPHAHLCFEDVRTQGAFMCWSQGYSLGVRDGQKDVWELWDKK